MNITRFQPAMFKFLGYLKFSPKHITIDHRRIAKGLALVFVFSLLGKLFGALKDAAIAYSYGIGEIVDLYSLAFVYAIWIPMIINGVIGAIFIPLIHKLPIEERGKFKNQLVSNVFLLAVCFSVAFYFLLPLLLKYSTLDLISVGTNSKNISLILAPIVGLSILSATFSAILLADEKHANTLFEAIPSITILLCIILWPSSESITPLLWGTLAGFFIHCACLCYFVHHSGTILRPLPSFDSQGWASLRNAFGVVVLSQLVMSFIDPISYKIAESLGSGGVSSLNYATKLIILFLTLGATAIARAILPVLSNTQRTLKQRIKLTIQWAFIAATAGLFACIFVWFFSSEIVRIVYERGAFTSNDTSTIAEALKLGAIQFPFYFSGIVLAQLIISLGHYKIILASSCLALVVKIISSLLLAPALGFSGIIAANVPMYAATNILFCVALYFLYKRSRNDPSNTEL